MPDLKRLYDEEMRHLLEAGREFARLHPREARLLALDEVEERDPVVDRLFQKFSFLAARIRETQEGADDRLARQLLEVAAPGWRDPLPSTAIVELVHREDVPVESVVVPRGSEVRIASRAGGEGFQFRLATSVEIAPIRVSCARIGEANDGTSFLHLGLTGSARSLRGFWPDRVAFFLGGLDANAWALRYWMLRRVRGAEVQGLPRAGVRIEPMIGPGGDQRALRDDGTGSMLHAMSDLRDFLCADERFRFLSFMGLGAFSIPLSEPLELRIAFDGIVPHSLAASVSLDTFRLHAAPVVNRNLRECEPIAAAAARSWHPLRAGVDGESEILAISDVQGCSQSDPSRRRSYPGIETGRFVESDAAGGCYHEVMARPRRSGGHRTSISVHYGVGREPGEDERLQVRAWCGDGRKPFENVDSGAVCFAGPGIPAGLDILGLTRPTPAFRPLDSGNAVWTMLGCCQRSFRDLLDLRSLRETLFSLHWDEGAGKRGLLEGIREVRWTSTVRLRRGIARPTTVVSISMRQDAGLPGDWGKIGMIDTFAEGLHRLFRSIAPGEAEVVTRVAVDPAGVVLEYGR